MVRITREEEREREELLPVPSRSTPAAAAAAAVEVEVSRKWKRNSKWVTFVSIYSMMYFPLGVGPAFAYTGWIPGLGMLSYSAWASFVSGNHLSKLCTEDEDNIVLDTYPKLARKLFQRRGEWVVTATQSSLYFMCGAFNIAYIPASFQQLLPSLGKADTRYMLITWGIMCVGSLLPTYHHTFYISAFSAAVSTMNAMLQLFVIFFYQSDLSNQKSLVGKDFYALLSALPAISYTFGGHGVFPEEVRELKVPKDFSETIRWLYLASLPWYYACSISSYWAYGDTIQGNPIANWPEGLWLTKVAAFFSLIGALVISVTSNQATLLAIENKLRLNPYDSLLTKGVLQEKNHNTVLHGSSRVLVRFSFVTMQLLIALLLSNTPLQFIQAFMGSFGVGCLTFVFPFVLYIKWKGDSVINWLFLIIGAILTCLGMVFSSLEILKKLNVI